MDAFLLRLERLLAKNPVQPYSLDRKEACGGAPTGDWPRRERQPVDATARAFALTRVRDRLELLPTRKSTLKARKQVKYPPRLRDVEHERRRERSPSSRIAIGSSADGGVSAGRPECSRVGNAEHSA